MIKKSQEIETFLLPGYLDGQNKITKFAVEKEIKPHQSRLGNSSNNLEMPRLFLSLMAGLNP